MKKSKKKLEWIMFGEKRMKDMKSMIHSDFDRSASLDFYNGDDVIAYIKEVVAKYDPSIKCSIILDPFLIPEEFKFMYEHNKKVLTVHTNLLNDNFYIAICHELGHLLQWNYKGFDKFHTYQEQLEIEHEAGRLGYYLYKAHFSGRGEIHHNKFKCYMAKYPKMHLLERHARFLKMNTSIDIPGTFAKYMQIKKIKKMTPNDLIEATKSIDVIAKKLFKGVSIG